MDNTLANGNSGRWPLVQFGELLERIPGRQIRLDDSVSYACVGVRWYGCGAFVRERNLGFDIARKDQWVIRSGDIVYNKLFAWKGAFAVADESVDGCIVSDKFPLYRIKSEALDPIYLRYFFQTPAVSEQATVLSKGAAAISKLTLNPPEFWKLTIPLPPLDEQRRIASRLTRVETLTGRLSDMSKEFEECLAQLFVRIHLDGSKGRMVQIGDILELDEDRVPIIADVDYPQVGVRSFGSGLFCKGPITASQTTYKHFNRLYDGCFVLSQVKGWEGAVAVSSRNFNGWFVSPEYRTFRCKKDALVPEYLSRLVRAKWFWSKLSSLTRGVGARRERTRPEQFLQLRLEMPDADTQRQLLCIIEQIEAASALHMTCAHIDALKGAILRNHIPY